MKHTVSSQAVSKSVSWSVLLPGILLVISFWFLFFSEWIKVGIIANPDTIISYRFGSDIMLEEGGRHYRTANAYATFALLSSVFMVPPGLAFVQASRKRTPIRILLAYGLFGVTWAILPLLNLLLNP